MGDFLADMFALVVGICAGFSMGYRRGRYDALTELRERRAAGRDGRDGD